MYALFEVPWTLLIGTFLITILELKKGGAPSEAGTEPTHHHLVSFYKPLLGKCLIKGDWDGTA
jgi:hypothetical protein